jgi:ATP-dependent Lon protease
VITKETVDNKYLTKYKKITEKKIHSRSEVGIINGLWANALANGGIIPIQARFFPSSTFLDLKLTGLQGDVMKESMNVAKTLAWNLTDSNIKKQLIRMFDETKDQGIHVHCPEGSISKDGPSAGAAITSALYSLFNNKPIKNDVAITGEICLNGEITAIGGLENKLNGGIRSGITKFLYPKSNDKDFNEWKNKDKNLEYCKTIEFIEVSHINDVFKHIFCSNSV